jgi:threonine/homoserine/homoserine lactone efflux protein
MNSPTDLAQALTAGIVCGFIVSVPVGPVNLTVINRALCKGFLSAFLAGLGAVLAETIYAAAMLAGHTTILDMPVVRDVMRVAAVLLIAAVGVKSLLYKEERVEARDAAVVAKVDDRWHHPRAFMLGFLLTISNLLLVVLWATLSTVLYAREWVSADSASRWVCTTGVFVGGSIWFFLLAFFVSRAHRRVKPIVLTYLVRSCGVVFLVFAVLLAYKLFGVKP